MKDIVPFISVGNNIRMAELEEGKIGFRRCMGMGIDPYNLPEKVKKQLSEYQTRALARACEYYAFKKEHVNPYVAVGVILLDEPKKRKQGIDPLALLMGGLMMGI